MTAEDQTTPTARAAETLRRGAGAAPMPGRGPRAFLRRLLLRVLRPYTHHQHELDTQVVAALRHQQSAIERHTEQIERLEELARELILTAESLRRASADAAGDAATARRIIEPIAAELYAPPYMADSPFELHSTPVGEALGFSAGAGMGAGEDAERGGGDSDYVVFEQLFRGPAERVAELQRPYLTLLRRPRARAGRRLRAGRVPDAARRARASPCGGWTVTRAWLSAVARSDSTSRRAMPTSTSPGWRTDRSARSSPRR